MRLRDYQASAVWDLRLLYANGARGAFLVAPCGAGKTVVFATIARLAVRKGSRVVVVVPRRELMDQALDKLTACGAGRLGIIAAGRKNPHPDAPVQVAMLWTLARRVLPWSPDLVIIDEAHLAKCATVTKLLARPTWEGARLLLASATPWRTDGKGFDDLAQAIVACPQVSDLVAAGHLVPAVTYSRQGHVKLDGLHRRAGEYRREEMAARFHQPKLWGDIVESWREHATGLRTICFASSVAHSKALCRTYNTAGIPAGHLDGSTPAPERLRLLAALAAGDLLVLVNCGVLCEGFDLPALGCVQVARKTASRGLWLQMTGRALRPAPGKTQAIILDHGANWQEHGLVDDVRTYTLAGRVKRDKPTVPAVRQCTACFRVYRSGDWLRDMAGWWQCPGCGHAERPQRRRPPMTAQAARLERVNARKINPIPLQRCPMGVDPALWARLELERIDKGYKPGWSWHRARTWQRRRRSSQGSW